MCRDIQYTTREQIECLLQILTHKMMFVRNRRNLMMRLHIRAAIAGYHTESTPVDFLYYLLTKRPLNIGLTLKIEEL